MQPIDFVHELLISELTVAIFAIITFALCLYCWFKYRDYDAVAFIFPCLYFIVAYLIFTFYPSLSDDWRRVIVRGGLVVLFIDIALQRGKCILAARSVKVYEPRNEDHT